MDNSNEALVKIREKISLYRSAKTREDVETSVKLLREIANDVDGLIATDTPNSEYDSLKFLQTYTLDRYGNEVAIHHYNGRSFLSHRVKRPTSVHGILPKSRDHV